MNDEAVRLWRLDDDPPAWCEAPTPAHGVEGSLHVTTPPHGASEWVAFPLPTLRAVREALAELVKVSDRAESGHYDEDDMADALKDARAALSTLGQEGKE